MAESYQIIMWDPFFKAIKRIKNRKRNNKNDSKSHTSTTIHTKHGLSPDSICFFCNNDEEIIPHMHVCPYCKESQIKICYNKTCKKLKVKSEEDKRKIYSIITTMISGPQDNETKEKFKHQLKHGWDKVIRGFLRNKSQAEMSQLSETIKNTKDLSTIITMVWETWENSGKQRNLDFNSTNRYEYQQRE
jgi:hypothetical protein